ncbi:MAG: nucleotidyltransferase domain-containing protein [Candidatus Lokiarchaeota archaeon]|nr:nucleotidyltransferase domain-containing protein [Candidatus Lokiarchaeota archaeon]
MKNNLKFINIGIKKFSKNVIKALQPKCIILYGSLARGDFNERSDVDIIVISSKLPENYYKRAELLYNMVETLDPIEPLGFTPDEFIDMIKNRHCTSLFAMKEGKALYGKDYFQLLKGIHEKIINQHKIIKGDSAWIPEFIE